MAYDPKKELERVRNYYAADPLQKRFSAIVCGNIGVGKTFLLSTARKPVFIDSFDPGGSKSLEPWIKKGDIVVDTSFENEDPYSPTAYRNWEKSTELRLQTKFYDQFGTYCLDSLSTFGDAVMNYVMSTAKGGSRAGEAPMHRRDYNPQKVLIVNRIKRMMSLPCDFFLTSHLKESQDTIGYDKEGLPIITEKYRMSITGNAILTIPLQFDEIYVLLGSSGAPGSKVKRELLLDSQGKYIARSRLKSQGKLDSIEEPDIRKLLKKMGLDWEDRPSLT